jgi:hypothetical protein
MDIPNVIEANKFHYERIQEKSNVSMSISSTTIKFCFMGIITASFCLQCKGNVFVSSHIQGLDIFASALSDFRCLAHAAWRNNLSLYLL